MIIQFYMCVISVAQSNFTWFVFRLQDASRTFLLGFLMITFHVWIYFHTNIFVLFFLFLIDDNNRFCCISHFSVYCCKVKGKEKFIFQLSLNGDLLVLNPAVRVTPHCWAANHMLSRTKGVCQHARKKKSVEYVSFPEQCSFEWGQEKKQPGDWRDNQSSRRQQETGMWL